MLIRPAIPADAPVIAGFNWLLASETEGKSLDKDRLHKGVEALILDPGKGFYLVAEIDGGVIGQLCITYEWSDWRNGVFWWFQSVYVDAAHRGRGVFTTLFNRVKEMARERAGVCGLRLYVEHENHHALEVYRKLGLKQTPYHIMEIDFVLPA